MTTKNASNIFIYTYDRRSTIFKIGQTELEDKKATLHPAVEKLLSAYKN
jgi:hypothetical protein